MKDIIRDNEKHTNKWAAIIIILTALTGVVVQIFFRETFSGNEQIFHISMEIFMALGVIVAAIIPESHYSIKKYVLILTMTLAVVVYCMVNATAVFFLYLLPLVLSCRYYDKKLLYVVGIVSFVSVPFVFWGSATLGFSMDLNLLAIEPNTTMTITSNVGGWLDRSIIESISEADRIKNNMAIAAPQLAVFLILYFVAFLGITKSGTFMMKRREKLASEKAAMERDLELAKNIQLSMVPTNFNEFGGEDRVDIHATMYAAKNVGGDFYDFFMLNEDKMCLVIGDVSGKGMPASLFMVKALTTIKNIAQMGYEPNEILKRANNSLNKTNSELLFVTVWLGILDLNTGTLDYCVGGHNAPLFKKAQGDYEYLEDDPNFVIAAMPDIEYGPCSLKMEKGDRIFLYTDGVTECRDVDVNDYGEERLKAFLDSKKFLSPAETIDSLKAELAEFTRDCEQFDDVTMLCLEY